MKKANLFLAILMAFTVSGCQEVPEDVKSRAEEQFGVTASHTDTDSGEKTDVVGNEKIGSITFECEPGPIETDEFYILKTEIWKSDADDVDLDELKEKMKRAAKDLVDIDVNINEIDPEMAVVLDPETGELTDEKWFSAFFFQNEDGAARIYAGSNDFFFASEKKANGNPFDYGERTVYMPDDYPDTVYDMNDGSQMTISQAIDQGDEIIKKMYANELFDKDLTFDLYRIAVHETDDDNIIKLFYRMKRSGLYLTNDGIFAFSEFDRVSMQYSYLTIDLIGDGSPHELSTRLCDRIAEKEKVDKIISYEDAKQRLGKGLAKNLVYTVTEAELRYCCLFKQIDTVNVYRPMWCFVLYDPADKRNTLPETLSWEPYPRVTAFVDAINGDLYYCNPFDQSFGKTGT